jgi:hypothetical protein
MASERTMSAQEARAATLAERAKRELEKETREAAGAGLPPPVLDLDADDDGSGIGNVPMGALDGAPDWAKVPKDFVMPAGWTIWFVRFPAGLTNLPSRGERQVVLWNLSDMDEKLAARRAAGNANRIIDEMTKQMIRAVDGFVVAPEVRDRFWSEVGGKCRHQLKSLYLRTHTMDEKENTDFFADCIASRTAG